MLDWLVEARAYLDANELGETSLRRLDLPVRANSSLWRAGIKSVEELVALLEEEGIDGLLGIRSIGSMAQETIVAHLRDWLSLSLQQQIAQQQRNRPWLVEARAYLDTNELGEAYLHCLDLPVRAYNPLRRAGIKNVGELVALLEEEGIDGLLSLRSIGMCQ